MVIPRVLSRGSVVAAQKAHFKAILSAAPDLPAVIYNSPYNGFATRADLFFALREEHRNLKGFKEFGGPADMRYAAENITSRDDDVSLMIGVDTAVFHGFVNCGATGDADARVRALELEQALAVLSSFDEGPDLVLYFKRMMVLNGDEEYTLHFNPSDELSESQRGFTETQLKLFDAWYADWSRQPGAVQKYAA